MTEEEEVNYNRERMLAKAWARAEEHLTAVRTVFTEMEQAALERGETIVSADYAQGYNDATDRWKHRLAQALEPPFDVSSNNEWGSEDHMIYLDGREATSHSFRCSCGANVFRQHKVDHSWYRCNGCGALFTGTKKE